MKIKILVSDPLHDDGVKILTDEKNFQVDVKPKLPPDELKKTIKGYDAIIVRSATKVTKDIIQAADKLRLIGRAGVGLDNVDVAAASKQGVMVVNAPAGNTVSTAEHTMSMIMALSRNVAQADSSMKSGKWDKKKFIGVELYGKTIGIVGLGRIGAEVAQRALSFEMKAIAFDPFLSSDQANKIGVELVDFDTLVQRADVITVHTPLTDETRHLLGKDAFKKMKNGVRVVNCARGGIVDEQALAEALASGKVGGAALDVFEKEPLDPNSPLLKFSNIVLTPHLGASTEEAQVNVSIDIARTVRDALLNGAIRNAINVPSVEPELLKNIEPYLKLSEKLGALLTQLIEGHIKQVKIRYVGDIVNYDSKPVTIALVKGMLEPILQETVNYVNALVIARERGIKIIETKVSEIEDFAHLIWVEVTTEKMKGSVMGTLFTKVDPRIVKINGYYVDAVPSGHMLIITNKDVPGVVGSIGTILGAHKINIAGMTFGRQKKGGSALSILNVDTPVPKELLAKIKKAKNIYDIKAIKLKE
jgi:D-3-phosphoglycerate dehydrogenase